MMLVTKSSGMDLDVSMYIESIIIACQLWGTAKREDLLTDLSRVNHLETVPDYR